MLEFVQRLLKVLVHLFGDFLEYLLRTFSRFFLRSSYRGFGFYSISSRFSFKDRFKFVQAFRQGFIQIFFQDFLIIHCRNYFRINSLAISKIFFKYTLRAFQLYHVLFEEFLKTFVLFVSVAFLNSSRYY